MGADAAASMPVQCGLLSVVSPETEFWLRRGIGHRQSKVITKKNENRLGPSKSDRVIFLMDYCVRLKCRTKVTEICIKT